MTGNPPGDRIRPRSDLARSAADHHAKTHCGPCRGRALPRPAALAQSGPAKALAIYLIDVEGGNATLFVSPSGESLLIDAGNPSNGRDADRIAAAAKDAGVSRIDHLIVTHFHVDHVGGVGELSSRLPVRHFIDHGPSVETNASAPEASQKQYRELADRGRHTVVKPGDKIPVAGLEVQVLASAGRVIAEAAARRRPRQPAVRGVEGNGPGPTENAQSVGSIVTFGKFRALHLGDLTWNTEHDLMCPNDRVGKVDLFVVSHHGQPISNSEVLVHAVQPRVMILNNGLRKGGQPPAMKILHTSPGLEDLWQLHVSMLSGQEYTCRACSSPTSTSGLNSDRPVASAAARRAAGAAGARFTTARRTGSRSRRRPTARSPYRTAATDSARPIARRRGAATH